MYEDIICVHNFDINYQKRVIKNWGFLFQDLKDCILLQHRSDKNI